MAYEPSFATKILGAEADTTAPDGTAVRLLLTLGRGSMAHFELPAGAVSHAVMHRTVEEIWYILSGRGALWRRSPAGDRIETLAAGTAVAIPLGTAFQFRAEEGAALTFLAVTMPPWPGMAEALLVAGPWTPTVAAGS
ncbi:MAG: cupin domain-containing protein [Hyphomicrobiales bacterium]|nr:cupin domain-containing protein [Hyphomicrobiales bacterium]